jgi:hypothetical protein
MRGRSFLRLFCCLALCTGVAAISGSVTYPEILLVRLADQAVLDASEPGFSRLSGTSSTL